MSQQVDGGKRRFLLVASSVAGGAAVVGAAAPFVASWFPSAKAKAAGAPVEVDISKLEPGQQIVQAWRGKPVWILKRTPAMMAALPNLDSELSDPSSLIDQQPEFARNGYRADPQHPDVFVAVGVCTHLGCSPNLKPEMEGDWKGGYICPCHGSRFDLAGRVFKGSPAPINLEIPPYAYLSNTTILVGSEGKGA